MASKYYKLKNVTFVRKSGKLLSDNSKGVFMFSGKLKKWMRKH